MEAVQTVASCEHEQIQIDFAKRVLFAARLGLLRRAGDGGLARVPVG